MSCIRMLSTGYVLAMDVLSGTHVEGMLMDAVIQQKRFDGGS